VGRGGAIESPPGRIPVAVQDAMWKTWQKSTSFADGTVVEEFYFRPRSTVGAIHIVIAILEQDILFGAQWREAGVPPPRSICRQGQETESWTVVEMRSEKRRNARGRIGGIRGSPRFAKETRSASEPRASGPIDAPGIKNQCRLTRRRLILWSR